jgi:sugar/nucleoside kinase (ribokinase family)
MSDTMGCGDAFLAGFVVSLLRDGWSRRVPASGPALERALRHGAEAPYRQRFVEAAFVCRLPGGASRADGREPGEAVTDWRGGDGLARR